jgi:acyl-CoA thioesterase FadM
MIPLLYDWLFGMVVTSADIRPTRTAYLHVDYRKITPIDEPLIAQGRISELDGRKVFIAATMTATDGTVLTEANGLMVRLLPHQP